MSQHWDLLIAIEKNYDVQSFGLKRIIREWKKHNPRASSLATLYNWVPKDLFAFGYEDKCLRPRSKKGNQINNCQRMIGRPIDLRKKEQNRGEFGHWEADLLVRSNKRESWYILTLLEKKSWYGITQKFSSCKPDVVLEGIKECLEHFNQKILKSITFDNGVEFTRCPELEEQFATSITFAHPNFSCQGEQNENNKEMMRRWWQSTNFNYRSQGELNKVTWQSNDMLSDMLRWRSATEVFNELLKMSG